MAALQLGASIYAPSSSSKPLAKFGVPFQFHASFSLKCDFLKNCFVSVEYCANIRSLASTRSFRVNCSAGIAEVFAVSVSERIGLLVVFIMFMC